MGKHLAIAVAVLLFLVLPSSAVAGLVGHTATVEFGINPSGGPFDSRYFLQTRSAPVLIRDPEPDGLMLLEAVSADFTDNSLHATVAGSFLNMAYNGLLFRLTSPSDPLPLRVNLIGTTITGFTPERVIYENSKIALNMAGLEAFGDVDLSITVVPEPPTSVLTLCAVACAALILRGGREPRFLR